MKLKTRATTGYMSAPTPDIQRGVTGVRAAVRDVLENAIDRNDTECDECGGSDPGIPLWSTTQLAELTDALIDAVRRAEA